MSEIKDVKKILRDLEDENCNIDEVLKDITEDELVYLKAELLSSIYMEDDNYLEKKSR